MTVRFVNWSQQQLLQETKQAPEKARLYAKSKDGEVTLYYSTKPRSLRELITGEKAKAARNALRGLLGAGSKSAGILSSIEGEHNMKHALRQNEVAKILTPISQKAAGESVPIFQETAGESAIFQKAAARDMQEMGPVFTPGKLQEFLKKHTVAALGTEFWADKNVQNIGDTLGCGLTLTIIDRIITAQTITEGDVAQLSRALQPYKPADMSGFGDFGFLENENASAEFIPLAGDLAGPLTSDKLSKILTSFYSKYVDGDSALNFKNDKARKETSDAFRAIPAGKKDMADLQQILGDMRRQWETTVNDVKIQIAPLIGAMSPKKSEPA